MNNPVLGHYPMSIDQLKEYHSENVQYVEFMASFACWNDHDRFIKAMAEQTDDPGRLAALRANGLDDCVTAKRNDLTASIGKIKSELGCDQQATRPGCAVTFRYIAQILRNTSPDDVFLQTAIATGLIRAEPQVVALNLVQSEDNLIARRDYTRHMEIVAFLASDVPVALHAGELWLGDVPPPDLTFHIRQAVEIAHARRIGHGVALAFEHDMEGLLAEMRRRPVGRLACSWISACVSATISITGVLRSSSSAPASVRLTERVERLSSRTPKRVSSSATYLLTVAFDMSSRLAAREKLPSVATSRKVFRRSKLSMGVRWKGWDAARPIVSYS